MSITNSLGRVMPVDKGAYNEATNYDRLDMVHTADSTYVSLVDDNVGNPVTDTTKWQCYADGKPATEAAAAATAAAGSATAAAAAANAAAGRAPYIGENGNWFVWSVQQNQYVDSGVDASAPELTIDPDYTIRKDGEVFTEAIKDANEQAQADHAQYLIDHASIAGKANVDGWYQGMTVGHSENLVDTKGQGTEQEFTRRTSCGDQSITDDGAVIFKSIRGKSLVWNQNVSIPDSNKSSSSSGITVTDNRDGSYSVSGTAEADVAKSNFFTFNRDKGRIIGHKYLLRGCPKGGSANTYSLRLGGGTRVDTGDGLIYTEASQSATTVDIIVKSGTVLSSPIKFYPQIIDLTLMFGAGNEPATVADFEALYPNLYYAYNAGKIINNAVEHYITDSFNQWDEEWELGSYDVATGEKINSSTEIRSKNAIRVFGDTNYYFQVPDYYSGSSVKARFYDANDKYIGSTDGLGNAVMPRTQFKTPANAAYFRFAMQAGYGTTYKNDICINLSWSGYRNGEYEPYWKRDTAFALLTATGKKDGEGSSVVVAPEGARSAGSPFDEWVVENGYITKFIKRPVIVDLGQFTFGYRSGGVFSANITGKKGGYYNLLCEKYPTITSGMPNGFDVPDGYISGAGSSNLIIIHDSKYSDAATFKTAMSGVHLVYELATPETYILDEPIFIGAPKVADFGTETAKEATEVDANGVPKSAPFGAVIKYSTDYPREIANLPKGYDTIAGLDDLCAALATTLGPVLNGTLAITRGAYDAANQKYAWSVVFTPNAQGE